MAFALAVPEDVAPVDREKYLFTYDDTGRISAIDYYTFDILGMMWIYQLRIDIAYSEGMPGMPFEELFIGPWGQGILPFMTGSAVVAR
jgi:hypothetical protein